MSASGCIFCCDAGLDFDWCRVCGRGEECYVLDVGCAPQRIHGVPSGNKHAEEAIRSVIRSARKHLDSAVERD